MVWIILLVLCMIIAVDASNNQITTDGKPYGGGNGAFVWFIACALLFILFCPLYLYQRSRQLNERRRAEMPVVVASSSADELMKFKQLLDAGAITQAEFEDKKRQLLRG